MRIVLALVLMAVSLSPVAGQTYTIRTFAGGGLPENMPGVSANLGIITGVAVDGAGNVYIAASNYNIVLRLDGNGQLTRVAGNGTLGYSGDGGPATTAQLAGPWGLAFDAAGNLYIADSSNSRIRKVSNGVITTVAGNGFYGYSGDNGPAVSAALDYPTGVAVDAAGNLYVADHSNNRVRKVSSGVITTVAGNGALGYGGDNGAATAAQLNEPWAVAVDASGNLYIADSANDRIRKVSDGVITTVAGGGAYFGDNGPATSAQLYYPYAVTVDSVGALYIADTNHNRVRRVSGGRITTVAGWGPDLGDGGPAVSANLDSPQGVAVDTAGTLYILDFNRFRIRKVSDGVITTVAGGGAAVGDGGLAVGAQLYRPQGLALDLEGSLYVADWANNRVRKVSNSVITTVAGTGVSGFDGDNGLAESAQLKEPSAVVLDAAGNLFIADYHNQRIRKVSNGVITTIAGTGACGYNGENIPALSAQLCQPSGLALDAAGNLYFAEFIHHRIRKVSNGMITTVAGLGVEGYSGDDGPAAAARLAFPSAVAIDGKGDLYIADSHNYRIRKVSNGVITTVAGTGVPGLAGDNGPALSARLNTPYGVAVDIEGNLFIADWGNHRIRRVSDGIITTVAGGGFTLGDNGPATSAELISPRALAIDPTGNVYVADELNHRVRVLAPAPAPCTSSISIADLGVAAAGGTARFSIHADPSCSWSISGLPSWLTVAGDSQGTGPADVTLVASTNADAPRTGSVTVGGVSVPIRQLDAAACGGSPFCVVRALPQLAFGGDWTTGLSAISSGTEAGSFAITFYGDGGNSISLPFTTGQGNLSTLSDSVPAQGLKYYEANDPAAQVLGGWGLVTADASITAHATFRRRTSEGDFYEAAVPASEGYSRFVMPFEATTFAPTGAPMYTGFAIANLNPSATANVVCTAKNQLGAVIPNAVTIPALPPLGHYANYLFPALTGLRGTFDCTADTLVAAIGLRAIGSDAFSTLPVIPK